MKIKLLGILPIFALAGLHGMAQQTDSLQKKALTVEEVTREKQNPMSGYQTVFLQNVTLPVGEGNANSLSVQPVFPFTIADKVKINTYTIIPFQWLPPMAEGGEKVFGMGNILFNAFLRPDAPPKGKWIWGVGPTLQIPTRTTPELGSNRLSMAFCFKTKSKATKNDFYPFLHQSKK